MDAPASPPPALLAAATATAAAASDGGLPGWAIGAIVGGTLLLLLLIGYAVMSFREGREKEDGEGEEGEVFGEESEVDSGSRARRASTKKSRRARREGGDEVTRKAAARDESAQEMRYLDAGPAASKADDKPPLQLFVALRQAIGGGRARVLCHRTADELSSDWDEAGRTEELLVGADERPEFQRPIELFDLEEESTLRLELQLGPVSTPATSTAATAANVGATATATAGTASPPPAHPPPRPAPPSPAPPAPAVVAGERRGDQPAPQ